MGGGAMTELFTHHGGSLAAAVQHFGGGFRDWLDLSTGINPVPWQGQVEIDWHPLPAAQDLAELEAAAAQHFGVAPQFCCAVPGSEMALRLMGQWLGRGAYHWPSYRTHASAFPEGAAGDINSGTAALLLANPNNPDGRIVARDDLRDWHDRLMRRDGWLVVDEAFADAAPQFSVSSKVGQWPRLITLRSFGKFFGLAGLRLGFVLAPPEVTAMLRAILGDWPLSAGAIAMGRAAYQDAAWIAQARRDLAQRATQMDRLLAGHGLKTRGACPHFRLIEDDAAQTLFNTLAQAHILSRPFDYAPHWLRLGIPARDEDFERLDKVLADG